MIKDQSVEIVRAGASLDRARAAVILLHGRGATAESMLSLADALAQPDLTYVAPQAPGHSWYPYSFLSPYEQNQPALSRALAIVGGALEDFARAGVPAERIALMGFSQGGCLALEFAARNARRYGAVVGLSAGLIGPDGAQRDYAGSLAGSPVFIGCGDIDGHIPLWRVRESARVMRQLGADVTERIYPGMDHTVNDDEIRQVRTLLADMGQRIES